MLSSGVSVAASEPGIVAAVSGVVSAWTKARGESEASIVVSDRVAHRAR